MEDTMNLLDIHKGEAVFISDAGSVCILDGDITHANVPHRLELVKRLEDKIGEIYVEFSEEFLILGGQKWSVDEIVKLLMNTDQTITYKSLRILEE